MGGSYVQQTALYGASPSLLRWHTAGLLQLWSLIRRRMGGGAAAEEEGGEEVYEAVERCCRGGGRNGAERWWCKVVVVSTLRRQISGTLPQVHGTCQAKPEEQPYLLHQGVHT